MIAISRAIGNAAAIWGGLITFLIMYYSGAGKPLNTVLIMSLMENLTLLKLVITNLGYGISAYFELELLFGSFSEILNIKNIQMFRIDAETREVLTIDNSSENKSQNPEDNQDENDSG